MENDVPAKKMSDVEKVARAVLRFLDYVDACGVGKDGLDAMSDASRGDVKMYAEEVIRSRRGR